MIKQKELMPKRRFEEFQNNDFWKQYNLKDITQKIGSGKTPRGGSSVYIKSGIPLLRSQNINNDQVDFEEVVYISESMDEEMSNSRVSRNDVLLNITGASIGRSAVYKHAKSANVNQHVCIIRPNQEFNSRFIQLNLTSVEGQKQIDINQAGGAREGLNFQQIGKMIFYYPGYKEQQKIGQFFKHLDEMITLEQRKIDKTKALKSAYLAEMFPAEGERIPKRRFAGYTDEWELCKLEDIIDKGGSGGTPSTSQSEYYNGDILFLGISDITSSNGYIFNTDKKITAKGLENSAAWIVPKESIALAMYASVGKVAILKKDIATSQAFFNMVISDLKTRDFIYQYLVKMEVENSWNLLISTGTQANLNAKKVRELEINIPSSQKERENIGVFFHKLDRRIALQDDKLDKLKATKQAYLHEMFV